MQITQPWPQHFRFGDLAPTQGEASKPARVSLISAIAKEREERPSSRNSVDSTFDAELIEEQIEVLGV